MKVYFVILLIFLAVFGTSASISENELHNEFTDYNEKIYEKYIKMDKQLISLAKSGVKKVLPIMLEAREHLNMTSSCTRNLFDMLIGLSKLTNWSFNFLDSLGKIQSGIAAGNLMMFGEYEECIETTVMKKEKVDFQGKFCSISIVPYLPKEKKIPGINGRLEGLMNATKNASGFMKLITSRAQLFYRLELKVGVCLPTGCTTEDLAQILKYFLGEYVNTTVNYCLKKGDIYFWTTKRSILVSVFVLLGTVIILSTFLDNTLETWKNNKLGVRCRILQCFSLTKNFPKLMDTKQSESSITCFNGIRVLTISWIILGHEYFIHAMGKTANHATNYEKMLSNFFSQIVLNGFVSVETFFFISGFLNCYVRMLIKQKEKSQPAALKIIFHRLWRIYPAYIAAFILLYLLNKPQPHYYNLQKEFTETCDLYWWRNILFINNFFDPYKMCLAQSWFLCVDMQLFLFTLFTIPILLRKPKLGIILHIGIILITNFCSMYWWLTDYIAPSVLDGTKLDRSESVKSFKLSIYPSAHVGPYFIGILLGYVIATKKGIKIPKIIQICGWITASLFYLSMLFMTLRWHSGTPYTYLESALYGAWSRTILVLGFSWLVFCCATGHAGLLNYILSLNLWVPLSKITYMIYLLSPLIQAHNGGHHSFPDDFSDMRIIWNYFANLSISILMSFAVVLIFESPFIAMEKIIFRRKRENQKISFDLTKDSTFNVRQNGLQESNWQESGKIATIHL